MSASNPPNIHLLFVHPFPHLSWVNQVLADTVQDIEGVHVHDLYELYPNFHIDVEVEQDYLRQCDLLVVQHPFYWYSAPALFKQWQDTVLQPGFAFGSEGSALQGKDWLTVVTAGQSAGAYQPDGKNHYTFEQLLRPYQCAANHCHMNYLNPITIPDAHRLSDEQLEQYKNQYRRTLEEYRPHREQSNG